MWSRNSNFENALNSTFISRRQSQFQFVIDFLNDCRQIIDGINDKMSSRSFQNPTSFFNFGLKFIRIQFVHVFLSQCDVISSFGNAYRPSSAMKTSLDASSSVINFDHGLGSPDVLVDHGGGWSAIGYQIGGDVGIRSVAFRSGHWL